MYAYPLEVRHSCEVLQIQISIAEVGLGNQSMLNFFVLPPFPLTKCPKILFLLFCGLKSQLHSDDGHVHATPCSVRVLAYQNVMHSSSLLCSHRLYKPSAGCICVHGEHTKIP